MGFSRGKAKTAPAPRVARLDKLDARNLCELLDRFGHEARLPEEYEEKPKARFVCWDIDDTVQLVATAIDEMDALEERFPEYCLKMGIHPGTPEAEDYRWELEHSAYIAKKQLHDLCGIRSILSSAGFAVDEDFDDNLPLWHLYDSAIDC